MTRRCCGAMCVAVSRQDDSTTLELRRSIKWFKGPACPTTAFMQLSKCVALAGDCCRCMS